jgi:hypothetical protein
VCGSCDPPVIACIRDDAGALPVGADAFLQHRTDRLV